MNQDAFDRLMKDKSIDSWGSEAKEPQNHFKSLNVNLHNAANTETITQRNLRKKSLFTMKHPYVSSEETFPLHQNEEIQGDIIGIKDRRKSLENIFITSIRTRNNKKESDDDANNCIAASLVDTKSNRMNVQVNLFRIWNPYFYIVIQRDVDLSFRKLG
jgi:hypothetical protein